MGRAHCGANQGKKWPVYYSVQKSITEKNKKRRLRKHVRNHPGDKQAFTIALEKLGISVVTNLESTAKGLKRVRRAAKKRAALPA